MPDIESATTGMGSMPQPTEEMLNQDPLFDAIWATIKSWDVNVPQYYAGYCGANGSHVALIYRAVKQVNHDAIGVGADGQESEV